MKIDVSVIVPAWNAARTLSECLSSIRASLCSGFELIVVDDHSSDGTRDVARRFTDTVVTHAATQGEGASRNSGAASAQGDILIFVDADVMVRGDTFNLITAYFQSHPHIVALTGRLAVEHPHPHFFSQYKNLYMHYIFGLLPTEVGFLYGSIHAIRAAAFVPYPEGMQYGTDTAAGMTYRSRGGRIDFLPDLAVVHLKEYTASRLFRNDFCISAAWARLFMRQRGYKMLFRNRTGFAHSPKQQILSVLIAPGIVAALICQLPFVAAGLMLVYLGLNMHFLRFLFRQRGAFFLALSAIVTFADNLAMAIGIIYGAFSSMRERSVR